MADIASLAYTGEAVRLQRYLQANPIDWRSKRGKSCIGVKFDSIS